MNNIALTTMDKFAKESSKINLKGKRIPSAADATKAANALTEIAKELQNLATLAQQNNMKMSEVAYINNYGSTITYNNVLGALQDFSPIYPFDKHGNRTHDNFGSKLQTKEIEIDGKKHLLDFSHNYCYICKCK